MPSVDLYINHRIHAEAMQEKVKGYIWTSSVFEHFWKQLRAGVVPAHFSRESNKKKAAEAFHVAVSHEPNNLDEMGGASAPEVLGAV